MGPEHFWWGGWWIFPIIMPLVMIVVVVAMLYFVFGRGGFRPPWWNDSDRPSSHSKDFYNTRRPHQSLDGQTPDKIYFNNLPQERIAA